MMKSGTTKIKYPGICVDGSEGILLAICASGLGVEVATFFDFNGVDSKLA
jgi:hypothetical protein